MTCEAMNEDTFKGWYHMGIGLLVGVAAIYNVMRLCATRERRNALNIALYTPLMMYEIHQAQHHWLKSLR